MPQRPGWRELPPDRNRKQAVPGLPPSPRSNMAEERATCGVKDAKTPETFFSHY